MQAFNDALLATEQSCPESVLYSGLPEGEALTPQWLARLSVKQGLNTQLIQLGAEQKWPESCELLLTVESGEHAGAIARISRTSPGQDTYSAHIYREHGSLQLNGVELSSLVGKRPCTALLVGPSVPVPSRRPKRLFSSWLFSEFRRMRPLYRDVLLATVLLNVFVIASPLFIMNVYDRVVPNQAFESLWVLASGVAIVLLFDLVVKLLRQFFVESAGRQMDVVLSTRLFDHVLNSRPGTGPVSVGAFASQFKEFDAIKHFFTAAGFSALVDLPFALFFLLIIFALGGEVVIVPLVAMLVILLYGLAMHFPLKSVVRQAQAATALQNATLVESLSILETLKAFNAEGRAQGRWEQSTLLNARLGLKARRLGDSIALVSGFVMQCSLVGLVIVGVYQIADYEMSLGALIACVLLGNRALSPMVQVAHLSAQFFQARVAMDALNQMTTSELEQHEGRQYLAQEAFSGEIALENVEFSYPDSPPVLRGINLKLNAGEHVALIGRIGSGKSTVLKLIAGMLRATKGQISMDGIGVELINPVVHRANCAYVPQDIALVSGTLRENLALKNRQSSDRELLAVCKKAGLFDWVAKHPMGLDLPISELGQGLSGGQRQGVAIARALLGQPALFLFDELSSAMDNQSEAQVVQQISALAAGKTMVIATHRASLLQLVDRIVVLDGGRVVADGPKAEVLDALKRGNVPSGVGA